ncbi:MAG: segregation/condensation protein A [Inquilinus sp.]|nr:segregation/condensation protein A [Inquilinus sp.]
MTEPSTGDDFEDGPLRDLDDAAFVLRLESYEGPIDVLLDQARDQKVDLTQISILALAEQYIGFVERARGLRLELAADYLVMAAWLAYLKSRLLLPEDSDDGEPSAVEMAEALAFQLRRLEAMREVGSRLLARPQLGRDWFARGGPAEALEVDATVYQVSLYDLLKSYADHRRRLTAKSGELQIRASRLYSMDEALRRLMEMLGAVPGWTTLASFMPAGISDPLVARSALASTFAASLELAKSGRVSLRQERPFDDIYLRRRETP